MKLEIRMVKVQNSSLPLKRLMDVKACLFVLAVQVVF